MNTPSEREEMKFILNGRTFDTSTSKVVAISRGAAKPGEFIFDEYLTAESIRYEDVLYQTAKGAFFVHCHRTIKYDRGKPVVDDNATELKPERVSYWIESNGAVVIDPSGISLPDEA